jgi:hypothetical protein
MKKCFEQGLFFLVFLCLLQPQHVVLGHQIRVLLRGNQMWLEVKLNQWIRLTFQDKHGP